MKALRWLAGFVLMVPFLALVVSAIGGYLSLKKSRGEMFANEAFRNPDSSVVIAVGVTILLFVGGVLIILAGSKRNPESDSVD